MLRPPHVSRRAQKGLATVFAAAVALGAAACSVGFSASEATGSGYSPPLNEWDAGVATPSVSRDGAADAATDAALPVQGNPLCNYATSHGCLPDLPASADSCPLPPDGGADAIANAGDSATHSGSDGADTAVAPAPTPIYACHVLAQSAGSPPDQTCTAPGQGTDGDACQRGTDCSAGYECVGSGECRHYCCQNDTCNATTTPSFCDAQTMLGSATPDTKVPVCMPIRTCRLLYPGYCAVGETCAVVRDDGTTSCVAIGAKRAGDDCREDHCAEACAQQCGERGREGHRTARARRCF